MKKIGMVLGGLLLSLSFSCQNPVESALVAAPELNRSALASSAPVVLEYARLVYWRAPDGSMQVYLEGVANLKNIAYQKSLTVHYGTGHHFGDKEWSTVEGTYLGPDENGYEQWYFRTPEQSSWDLILYQFALNYQVGGQSYWDNNTGRDYELRLGLNSGRIYDGDHGVLNNGPLGLQKATYGNQTWGVQILVKNLAYTKNLRIVSTNDGWATSTVTNAAYFAPRDSLTNVEVWTGYFPSGGITNAEFYLEYEVNGRTYVDNNRGQNYKVDLYMGVK